MEYLNHLEIKNFRKFDAIEIDGMSRVNFFVGQNNSGKTTILEAVFQVMGMSNPMLPINYNSFRGMTIPAKDIQYLFHNCDSEPTFLAKFQNGTERQVSLKRRNNPFDTNKITLENINFPNSASTSAVSLSHDQNGSHDFHFDDSKQRSSIVSSEIAGIDIPFSIRQKGQLRQFSCSISFEIGNIAVKQPRSYIEAIPAFFVPNTHNDRTSFPLLSEIVRRKADRPILELLQAFDPSIVEMKLLNDGVYFNVEGIDILLPINALGYGARRLLTIAAHVSNKAHSVVCIDEIENGLHYTAFVLLLKGLLMFSHQNDVQLFITTHNIEILKSLKEILEEPDFQTMQDEVKVFSLAQTKSAEFKAYNYNFAEFQTAIDNDLNIRQ